MLVDKAQGLFIKKRVVKETEKLVHIECNHIPQQVSGESCVRAEKLVILFRLCNLFEPEI